MESASGHPQEQVVELPLQLTQLLLLLLVTYYQLPQLGLGACQPGMIVAAFYSY